MAGAVRKVVDERLYLSRRKGGGVLRSEIWTDAQGTVVRYSLAYVNPLIYAGDHGRVLGYDAAHGTHHRHYMGEVSEVAFDRFERIEARFYREWAALVKGTKRAEN
ncbi:MAG TPA: DUF6516 family protein [Bryobacteraceae bacterium]|jgi:hypothetical protein